MNTTIYASDYLKLDSDVYTGGGTDETEILQSLLDKAVEWGQLRLVMDGAALVSGLKVHSNTTIECMNKGCGFYLKDDSNCAIITNYNANFSGERETRNISLIGGTYNHNCLHQAHHVESVRKDKDESGVEVEVNVNKWSIAVEFYGIENLNVKDLTVRDQRTFAFTVGNFRHVNVENTYIELVNEIPEGNQDGFHFWGPGQFLTMRNIGGKTEDDFMNIGPDERDGVSSITDVLIDGVFLDHAWQGIRLLSRGTGLLDRVTIRNVTGTYNAYGFYINPWFVDKTMGNFGNITFENIDLRPEKEILIPNYYIKSNPAFLFSIGGDFESLTFRNISWYHSEDNRNIFQIGCPFHIPFLPFEDKKPRIKNMLIDGIKIIEDESDDNDTNYIVARGIVDRLTLRDVDIVRPEADKGSGSFVKVLSDGEIGKITLDRADIENIGTVVDITEGSVDKMIINNVLVSGVKETVKGENCKKIIGKETNI